MKEYYIEKWNEINTELFSPDYKLFYFYLFFIFAPVDTYIYANKQYFFNNNEDSSKRKDATKILLFGLLVFFISLGLRGYYQIQFAVRAHFLHAINLYYLSVLSIQLNWIRKRKTLFWALIVLFVYMQCFYLVNHLYYNEYLHHDYGRIKTGFVEFLTFIFLFPYCIVVGLIYLKFKKSKYLSKLHFFTHK